MRRRTGVLLGSIEKTEKEIVKKYSDIALIASVTLLLLVAGTSWIGFFFDFSSTQEHVLIGITGPVGFLGFVSFFISKILHDKGL